jgi:hypothetical protein
MKSGCGREEAREGRREENKEGERVQEGAREGAHMHTDASTRAHAHACTHARTDFGILCSNARTGECARAHRSTPWTGALRLALTADFPAPSRCGRAPAMVRACRAARSCRTVRPTRTARRIGGKSQSLHSERADGVIDCGGMKCYESTVSKRALLWADRSFQHTTANPQ